MDEFNTASNLPQNETTLLIIAEARPNQSQQIHLTEFKEQVDVLVIGAESDVIELHHIWMCS